jgi:riboflavin kinase / FMN adenylyltransferase
MPSASTSRKNVLTIGNFDGVHVGHVALIRQARALADVSGGRIIALTFDPHPNTLLKPDQVPDRLTTFERRKELLQAAGADLVLCLWPTPGQLSLSPEAFVEDLVREHQPCAFVEGSDFHFGKARRGNVELLAKLGKSRGFVVHVVDPVEVDLSDQHIVRASSSLTRWLLSNGRVQDAARVLGRPYELTGPVVQGDRRGRDLGFPTANIATSCALPMAGIYAATATLPDETEVPAAVSVGPRPTFDAPQPRLEAFLLLDTQPPLGHPIPGVPEYGWSLTLRLRAYLREQVKFDTIPELLRQMARDCERALQVLGAAPAAECGVTSCP